MTSSGVATAIEASSKPRSKLEVLIVDDSFADSDLMILELQRGGFDVAGEVVQTADQVRRRVQERTPDVVLAEYSLGHGQGQDVQEIIRGEGLDIPLILVSGAQGDETAVECIKQGATDYVLKDSLARLPDSVRRALQEKQLRDEHRLALEQLAKKIEELARSNSDLEQFAYAASHDLQEPLRMVASYTLLLGERYTGKLDAQADKYIEYAMSGAIRMQTLIQDLLAISSVGRPGMAMERTDCNAAVKDALESLRVAIETSRATIVHGFMPTVMANAVQLRQVFQNLVANAMKFHGPAAPEIQIEAQCQGNEWIFSVKDNGIGIAPEHAVNIFIVFNRLHTRVEYDGNGIGLAICKKIIEQHGGRIWVDSHKGPGATFKFTLPAATQFASERAQGGTRQ
jgi:signal transduction histidine kinase